jgi:two-component system, LytTR family, response regulator
MDRLVVKSGGSTRFVRVADIDWIEAAGVNANLYIGGTELLYRAALNELAGRLDPVRFVQEILKDGSRSRISRTYRRQLEKRLGQSL